jgi:hypothetical protein
MRLQLQCRSPPPSLVWRRCSGQPVRDSPTASGAVDQGTCYDTRSVPVVTLRGMSEPLSRFSEGGLCLIDLRTLQEGRQGRGGEARRSGARERSLRFDRCEQGRDGVCSR